MSTFFLKVQLNGALVDADTVAFASEPPATQYGVRRADTFVSVVSNGTAISRISKGNYSHNIVDPEGVKLYEYSLHIVHDNESFYVAGDFKPGNPKFCVSIPSLDHYTSQAEVYRMLGNYAVDLMMDDTAGRDNETWDDMLEDADETIKMYVNQHYDPAILNTSTWVRRRATVLVSNIVSQRRGNPGLFNSRTDRVYEELNEIRRGRFHIPGIPTRGYLGPVVRNYIMQNRFRINPVRVDKMKSTGPSYPKEDISIRPFVFNYG